MERERGKRYIKERGCVWVRRLEERGKRRIERGERGEE